ncbi:hypothetical protein DIZ27_32200 [Streptomyces sp. NWU339]|uniref:hypothetical protein n=1 Tax=Streptomyces sp. NWU339 TaxID=2185284 RepID=UPI000D6722A7|nr:hypothetical protein [Streptomyces sp. NWU339]PWI06639.1 hypothetical protein DIZ27_32200 [Streptomyces sp. NWU339]
MPPQPGVFDTHMPGATPELMDRAPVGESTAAPPYVPQPEGDTPEHTKRISNGTLITVGGTAGTVTVH